MKKFLAISLIFLSTISSINAEEIKRIFVGNKDAKITIIAFESLTCSHCANFHKDVYPELKKNEKNFNNFNIFFLQCFKHSS